MASAQPQIGAGDSLPRTPGLLDSLRKYWLTPGSGQDPGFGGFPRTPTWQETEVRRAQGRAERLAAQRATLSPFQRALTRDTDASAFGAPRLARALRHGNVTFAPGSRVISGGGAYRNPGLVTDTNPGGYSAPTVPSRTVNYTEASFTRPNGRLASFELPEDAGGLQSVNASGVAFRAAAPGIARQTARRDLRGSIRSYLHPGVPA